MRLDGLNLDGMRLDGQDIGEARVGGNTVFSSKPMYKQDGLMALFMGDSKTNTSPNKNVWKNLGSGGNLYLQNFAYTPTSGWTGESLSFDGVDDWSGNLVLPDNVHTIEYVHLPKSSYIYQTPVTNWALSGNGIRIGSDWSSNSPRYSLSCTSQSSRNMGELGLYALNALQSVCLTYDISTNKFSFYYNGVLKDAYASSSTEVLRPDLTVGVFATNNTSYKYFGELFCVRAYNRHLTAAEVLYNYNIDKEAYRI